MPEARPPVQEKAVMGLGLPLPPYCHNCQRLYASQAAKYSVEPTAIKPDALAPDPEKAAPAVTKTGLPLPAYCLTPPAEVKYSVEPTTVRLPLHPVQNHVGL